jgi:hypothetical protein
VRPRTDGGKALLLACWNAVGVRGRKLELKVFVSEHGDDFCLLNETHFESDRTLRFANDVCHRADRPTPGVGTAILVRRGIDHYGVCSTWSLVPHCILNTSSVGDQTSEVHGDLPFAHKTLDQVGPD